MRHWTGALLLAAGLSLGAGAASAETYFSFYTGNSSTQNSDLLIQQPTRGTNATYRDVSWDGQEFENPPYYAIKLGLYSESDPNWGVELDFIHYKVYADLNRAVPVSGTWDGVPINGAEPLGNRVQQFSISHGVNTLALNVLYRWRGKPTPSFPHGRLQPYVGGGPAYYILHPENTINGRPNQSGYEFASMGWQALGGIRYGLNRRTSVFIEGKYSDGKAKVDTADGGWAETDLKTWHAVAGIQRSF